MKKMTFLLSGALLLASAGQATADTQIKFMRNGKSITSIPLDKLNEVTVMVNSGGPSFKQLYKGQWAGIDQMLALAAKPYKKGLGIPSINESHTWSSNALTRSSYDSTWASKKTASNNFAKAAESLRLYRATDGDDLVFTTRFRRKVYTGKTIWKKGGYIKQTRWETVGPYKGMSKLSLQPPTFAGSLKPEQLFSSALKKFNATPENKFQKNKAMFMSQQLLYPTSYGGQEVTFHGSEVVGFSKGEGTPVFNWNYGKKGEWVTAKFPVKMKIKAIKNTKIGDMPVPLKTEAIFECSIQAEAERYLSSSTWTVDDLNVGGGFRESCRTADGKTADEIMKSANPLGGVKDAGAAAKDLLKGFGF